MIKIHKLAACLLIGTLAFASKAVVAEASEEPVAGINLVLEEIQNSQENVHSEVVQYLQEVTEYHDLAFAKVTNYVNIRSTAGEEGEILGKLYNNSAASILSEKDGWYEIKSGSVKGYIKSEFLRTGEEAVEIAKTQGNRLATINTTSLKVRTEPTLVASVRTLVSEGDELQVAEELSGWVKVKLEGETYGYVSRAYINLHTEYEEAVSIEEERERLAEEAAAVIASNGEGAGNTTNKSSSNSRSSLRDKIVSYALQFEGNPYRWGGTSLTKGADCSGFTKSVFANFGINITRTSRTQANGGRRVSLDSLRPGDLVFYARNGRINHVAIYIGNGKVISASSPETGIRITAYNYRTPYKAVSYID